MLVNPHRWPPQRRGRGHLRQLVRALLFDCDTAEGMGAVPPCRQYTMAAGSEGDEEAGSDVNPHWRQPRRGGGSLSMLAGRCAATGQ